MMKTDNHIVSKDRVCPKCKSKGSIVFWKNDGIQQDLSGHSREVMSKERPRCTRCGEMFDRNHKFEMIR